jgi:hypothetical protein
MLFQALFNPSTWGILEPELLCDAGRGKGERETEEKEHNSEKKLVLTLIAL